MEQDQTIASGLVAVGAGIKGAAFLSSARKPALRHLNRANENGKSLLQSLPVAKAPPLNVILKTCAYAGTIGAANVLYTWSLGSPATTWIWTPALCISLLQEGFNWLPEYAKVKIS